MLQTTALGAAFLGGLGAGFWPDTAAIRAAWAQDRRFEPSMPAARVAAHLGAWREAVSKA